ncbi:MAG: DNA polymerase III epsilon subunit (EC [uncultured Sulfurovum sp.]|uniref:DNA polymerase III epsilon subunit (EC) n=1 Tax=uncultured Sulfurovum sp. TaxID=269237 RepID=A0A6S6S4X0_9BACT|nr:MAG: DNA polymerase III epsilon subunit (EC [uncultured Sulfurovum sp.]
MRKVYEELTSAFRRNEGYLSVPAYERIVQKNSSFPEDFDTLFILLQAAGYPIIEVDGRYRLETFFTPYSEQKYCVIDIETNGSKPETAQVIEVGAVMIQNGKVVDRFESFVACAFLPEYISKITGILPKDLIEAPSQLEVLTNLRTFMEDAIFVAHNVNFDYGFLNHSFDRFGLGSIGNPKLCSIELARRTIKSERYGLAYLSETLELGNHIQHRAFSDALVTSKLLELTFKNLPNHVQVVDDLLRFSTSSRKDRTLIKLNSENKK